MEMKSSRFITILTWLSILAVVAFAVGPGQARAADINQDISRMIATAKTAKDHEAIAVYYDQQAQRMKDLAEEHASFEAAYKTWEQQQAGALFGEQKSPYLVPIKHCAGLVKLYSRAAEDYEALAKMHREIAQKLSAAH
jgi:hypothetical protein